MKQSNNDRAANAAGRAQGLLAASRYLEKTGKIDDARFMRDLMRLWGTTAAWHIKFNRPLKQEVQQ